jgi:hypothetical protein
MLQFLAYLWSAGEQPKFPMGKFSFTVTNVLKLFMVVISEYSYQTGVFVQGGPFQLSLMFLGKARRLLKIVMPEKCFTKVGSCLVWAALDSNTLSYYKH